MTWQLLLRSRQRRNRTGRPSGRPWMAGPQSTRSRLLSLQAGLNVQKKHRLRQSPA